MFRQRISSSITSKVGSRSRQKIRTISICCHNISAFENPTHQYPHQKQQDLRHSNISNLSYRYNQKRFFKFRQIRFSSSEQHDDSSLEDPLFEDFPHDLEDREENSDNIIDSGRSLDSKDIKLQKNIHRLIHMRNVGVLAHVDAGKTTVTERMLALAGVVRQAGSVDEGNTVTDYLPAERERGITIQCAAISFPWPWHNNNKQKSTNIDDDDDFDANDNVTVSLIDTPGHVDFSVEVNRSVAVLDGAVLVIDAVAGVQAQTETVWKAMTHPQSSMNNHITDSRKEGSNNDDVHINNQSTRHEPLPCVALINKMDKEGCNFQNAVQSIRRKLPNANPIPIQLPLFRKRMSSETTPPQQQIRKSSISLDDYVCIPVDTGTTGRDKGTKTSLADENHGDFVGVVDLIHMRAIIWPDHQNHSAVSTPEHCIPFIVPLIQHNTTTTNCSVTQNALAGRWNIVESLAECGDVVMEDYYIQEVHPSNTELREAVRRVTLSHRGMPVMAGAALRGMGVEPLLDSIADYLPSPLDRQPPDLLYLDGTSPPEAFVCDSSSLSNLQQNQSQQLIQLGHSLHPTMLAFAFKVVHMKGRGGSGDGRVVFARVYSGTLRDRDVVQVISPPPLGSSSNNNVVDSATLSIRKERIGGMLELAGGRFSSLQHGECKSGGVCALVGLKSVVTGDTIVINPSIAVKKSMNSGSNSGRNNNKRNNNNSANNPSLVCLAGVAAPKPVLKVRLEAETTEQQSRLSEALELLAIEDPSLVIEETESTTLLSGLGELHIDVTLDRLKREYNLVHVHVGTPSVTYRETITETIETANGGLHKFDRMIGGTRLQASVHIVLKPITTNHKNGTNNDDSYTTAAAATSTMMLTDPTVSVSTEAKLYMGFNPDATDEDLIQRSELYRGLVQGCKGALKRGPIGSYPMSNVHCHVVAVHADDGISALQSLPGSLRAAAADAIGTMLVKNQSLSCTVLEPQMSIEIILPNSMVGTVLSDLTGTRRGTVGDVYMGDTITTGSKALIRGEVPLIEILGYATSLRSLTGGEGTFTVEYMGHSPFHYVPHH